MKRGSLNNTMRITSTIVWRMEKGRLSYFKTEVAKGGKRGSSKILVLMYEVNH